MQTLLLWLPIAHQFWPTQPCSKLTPVAENTVAYTILSLQGHGGKLCMCLQSWNCNHIFLPCNKIYATATFSQVKNLKILLPSSVLVFNKVPSSNPTTSGCTYGPRHPSKAGGFAIGRRSQKLSFMQLCGTICTKNHAN